MTLVYTAKLGFTTQKTCIRVKKIVSLPQETYSRTLTRLSLQDSLKKVWFFEETFLLAEISMEIVLKMPILALSNANFSFGTEKLT